MAAFAVNCLVAANLAMAYSGRFLCQSNTKEMGVPRPGASLSVAWTAASAGLREQSRPKTAASPRKQRWCAR